MMELLGQQDPNMAVGRYGSSEQIKVQEQLQLLFAAGGNTGTPAKYKSITTTEEFDGETTALNIVDITTS